jgi:hypothetical protein
MCPPSQQRDVCHLACRLRGREPLPISRSALLDCLLRHSLPIETFFIQYTPLIYSKGTSYVHTSQGRVNHLVSLQTSSTILLLLRHRQHLVCPASFIALHHSESACVIVPEGYGS